MSLSTFWGLALYLVALALPILSTDPIVTIANGDIRGRIAQTVGSGMTYYAYQGIPYAQPPIGNLRFAPPVAVANWSGIKNTTQDGSVCVQSSNPVVGTEDCLFINVYTPEAPGSTAALSVMLYIHGGGFIGGDATYVSNSPDYLLEQNVVFVAIQYRLGIFGFCSLGDTVAPGNYGMLDQVLAMEWVRDNVARFGGNPNDVTLFGQSAGAASVSYHRQSPLSQGLFNKIIMDSGVTLSTFSYCRTVPNLVRVTATTLLVSTLSSTATVQGLRAVNYTNLQTAASNAATANTLLFDPSLALGFCPVIEPVHPGAFITQPSRQMLLNGDFAPVPALVGYNSGEGSLDSTALLVLTPLFLQWDLLPLKLIPSGLHVSGILGLLKTYVGILIRNQYFGLLPITISNQQIMTFVGDQLMNRAVRQYVKLTWSAADTYFYEFSYRGQMGGNLNQSFTGAAHTEELRYIFISPFPSTDPEDVVMRNTMVAMWTNFAKHGNPTPAVRQAVLSDITWPTSNANFAQLNINSNSLQTTNAQEDIMVFWDDLFDDYENPPYDTY